MNLVLFNFHDLILLLTMGMYFTLALSHISLIKLSRFSYICLLLFCLASAAIPLDILISFGAGFREFALLHYPHIFFIFDIGYWVQAPLLFLFLKSLMNHQNKLYWSDAVLFLPFFFFIFHQTFSFYLLSGTEKVALLNSGNSSSFSIQYVVLLREILRLIVFCLCLRIVAKHFSHQLKKLEPQTFFLLRPWPVPLTFGLVALASISVIDIFFVILSQYGYGIVADALGLTSNYLSMILVTFTVIIAINSEPLQSKYSILDANKQANNIDKRHISLIEKAMQEDKLFLENDLCLEALSKSIGLSPRAVSLVINRHFNCNFFEFVNRHRIEEAKRMMDDSQYANCNILDIMLETGFNNKATFNTFFKKTLGMTPREYRKRHNTITH